MSREGIDCCDNSNANREVWRDHAKTPARQNPKRQVPNVQIVQSEFQIQSKGRSDLVWFRPLRIRACLAFGGLGLGVFAPAVAARPYAASPAPGVSFEQRIGERLPADVPLRDENDRAANFGQLLANRPAVLIFGYSRCPQLCSVVSNAAVETLRDVRLTAGRDFGVVYVSIDPTDTARELAAMKRRDVGRYGRSDVESGWHYVGGDAPAIRRLANAAGFQFTYDERQKLYGHPSGFLVLTPDGRISRYFLGVDFDAKDVANALERAREGKTGQSVYNLILVCARGLGVTGKYGRIIWGSLEAAVVLTIALLFGSIAWMLWQERRGFGMRDTGYEMRDAKGESPDRNPASRDSHLASIARREGTPPTSIPGGGALGAVIAFAFRDWLPERASTLAPKVDSVFWTLVGVTVVLVVGLAVANLYFLIRYRRGSNAPRPPLKIKTAHIETTWISATTIGFVGFFFWGAHVYLDEERPPADAIEIQLTARQWMWDIRHENGRREFNELHVPLGEDVRLAMTSEDVIHSFFVPAFRLKQDVVPGKQVSTWFCATKTGTFHLFCAEYCGTVHSGMVGDVVVMPPQTYAEWLARGNTMEDLVQRGRRLFTRYNCSGCHDQPAAVHAPPLDQVYGSLVPTADGRMVRADELYLRDSILRPEKDIVAGYQPLMPAFQNVIPETDLLDLIAYLKWLAKTKTESAPNP